MGVNRPAHEGVLSKRTVVLMATLSRFHAHQVIQKGAHDFGLATCLHVAISCWRWCNTKFVVLVSIFHHGVGYSELIARQYCCSRFL